MTYPEYKMNHDIQSIKLLDGRFVEIDFVSKNMIPSDMKNHQFDFTWVIQGENCHSTAKNILRGMFSTHSLPYVENCTRFFSAVLIDAFKMGGKPVELLRLADFSDWPKRYGISSWPFARAILSKWIDADLPGLDPELIAFLHGPEAFEERDDGWYFALVANDPERGAFTEQELKSVRDGVNRAFEEGAIDLFEWALVWFLIATGVRPVQIARMRLKDVIITTGPEVREITLCIPLAKGEQQIGGARWKRKSPSVLTDVLLRYLAPLANADPETPLFVMQSCEVTIRITSIFKRVRTWSNRTGGQIPIFPYRFRYTLGTRAMALGATDHEVARLLTHRSTRCVQYYRAALPTLQRPIAEAIGPEMAFIASVFQGRPIDSLEAATRKGQPGSVIRDFAYLIGQTLGACGTSAKCHQYAPRACLTCHKFEPLRNAPWEQLLQVLLDDLESETEDRIRLITQEQVDAVRAIIFERDSYARAFQ
jgi:integrase